MKYLKYLLDVLVYACALVGVILLVLMATDHRFVSIKTGSMEPEISVGDLCLVKPVTDGTELRQGDIITFEAGDSYVTHRIVSDNGDGTYSTKGDANKVYDNNSLPKEAIMGKVRWVVPSVGVVLEIATDKYGKLVLIAGLAILVSLSLILDLAVKKKETKKLKTE